MWAWGWAWRMERGVGASKRQRCAACMQCMCSVRHLEAEDVEQPDVTALAHAGRGDECRVDERYDLVEDARV